MPITQAYFCFLLPKCDSYFIHGFLTWPHILFQLSLCASEIAVDSSALSADFRCSSAFTNIHIILLAPFNNYHDFIGVTEPKCQSKSHPELDLTLPFCCCTFDFLLQYVVASSILFVYLEGSISLCTCLLIYKNIICWNIKAQNPSNA